jgi:hypothetical protein
VGVRPPAGATRKGLAMTQSPEVEVPFVGDDVVNDYIAKYSNWAAGAPTTNWAH